MKKYSNHINIILTCMMAVALFMYWWKGFGYMLSYQEQWQMFAWTGEYLQERLMYPGGMASYIGELLTQYYYDVWIGALILTALLVANQQMMWRMMRPWCDKWMYPLSFVPLLLITYLYGDHNIKLSYLVAVDIALLVTWAYSNITNKTWRIVYGACMMPLAYWLFGPAVFVLALYASVREWKTGLVLVAEAVLCPLICAYILPYELWRLATGVSYYRQNLTLPIVAFVIWGVAALLPFAVRYVAKRCASSGKYNVYAVLTLIVVLAAVPFVPKGVNENDATLIEYMYMLRRQDWDGIVDKASKSSPNTTATISILNLALAEKGQLCDNGFYYNQYGVYGLVPEFNQDFNISYVISEVFYHLGMANATQQFAFESQEGISDFSRSALLTRRLAETNMVNGQYEVARKYLLQLQKTTYYSDWANEAMTYLGNEDRINAHEQWGRMRRCEFKENFLFSDLEIDLMYGQAYVNDPTNTMAMQYLVFSPILERNKEKYGNFLGVVMRRNEGFNPTCCREIAGQYGNTWRYLMAR